MFCLTLAKCFIESDIMNRFTFYLILILAMAGEFFAASAKPSMVSFYRHRLNDKSLPFEQRLKYADSLIMSGPTDRLPILVAMTSACFQQGKIKKAADYANQLFQSDIDSLPLHQRLNILYIGAGCFMKTGDYAKATEICKKILDLKKPDSLLYRDIDAYAVLSDFNRLRLNRDFKYQNKAEEVFEYAQTRNLPKPLVDKMRYSVLMMRLHRLTDQDSLEKALSVASEIEKLPAGTVNGDSFEVNLAFIYLKMGEFKIAEECYKSFLAKKKTTYSSGIALLNLTHILNEEKRFDESLEAFQQYNDVLQYLDNDLYYTYAIGNHAIALAGIGNYKEAYEELMRSKLRTDTIYFDTYTSKSILNYEMATANDKIKEADSKINQLQLWLWIVGVAAGSLLALWIIGMLNLRSRNRDFSALVATNREMKETDEKERSEMARNNSSQALQIEQLQQILSNIKNIVEGNGAATQRVRDVANEIRSLDMSDSSWEMFNLHFEKMNPAFFSQLRKRNPELTPNDLRLAAYIQMNMTTKEIADLTCRSTRSVDSARYRLAKKLTIPEGETLASYLASVSQEAE